MDNRTNRTKRKMKPLWCLQVNYNTCAAMNNLVQMMSENQIDLAFVKEPYIIHNVLVGIPKSLRTFVSGNGRKQSALLVNHKDRCSNYYTIFWRRLHCGRNKLQEHKILWNKFISWYYRRHWNKYWENRANFKLFEGTRFTNSSW